MNLDNKVKIALANFLWMLTPAVLMVLTGVISYAIAQQDKRIDGKALKSDVAVLCERLKEKVDNETVMRMIETLNQKDAMLEKRNDEQDRRLDYQRDLQKEQLGVLLDIKLEMVKIYNNITEERQ